MKKSSIIPRHISSRRNGRVREGVRGKAQRRPPQAAWLPATAFSVISRIESTSSTAAGKAEKQEKQKTQESRKRRKSKKSGKGREAG